jgi:hypothetical protein
VDAAGRRVLLENVMNRTVLSLSLALLVLCACGGDPAETSSSVSSVSEPEPAAATSPASGDAPGDAPAPISSRGEAIAAAPASPAGEGGIDFDLPAGWQSQPPSSSMRVAQATISGPGGAGDLAVFHFGVGGGGGVEANIERWIGQMETTDQPEPETFEANGFRVTWIDVQGTLKPSSMGMGPATAQADSRLFGAVVEGPGGPWFFKATGPDATLGPQRDAFVAMLKGVRAQ